MIKIFTICFLLSWASAASQPPILLQETFDNNHNDWTLGEGAHYSAKIENGRFILTTLEEDRGRYFTVSPFINPEADFILQASFLQKSGLTDNGIGLLWGREGNQYNAFQFAINGYYKVHTPEKIDTLNKWKPCKRVKGMLEINVVRIEQKNKFVRCFINDVLVTSFPSLPFYGRGIGFVNNTKMVLEVDDFIFRHDVKLNLPTSLIGFTNENLGPSLNTIDDEVNPKISATGHSLYFGRKLSKDNMGGELDEEDIWFSVFENNEWSLSKNMGEPINSTYSNNLISVSTDENAMIFTTKDGFGIRERTKNGWAPIQDIGIKYTNEDAFIEGNLSSDGKAILFTVMNSENIAYNPAKVERDIYVSLKSENGIWSTPINLGKNVNTSENEYSPFLAADGKTLYFASRGWPGYGNADIFMSKRLDNTWVNWTEPVNLGAPINTIDFDAYYTVPASGDYAYLSSTHQSIGKSDLFRVKIAQEIKPEPVVLISGHTVNSKSNQAIQADVFFEDLATGKEVGEAISNPTTGEFSIVLPYGVNYGIRAVAKGFLSVNENFNLAEVKTYAEVRKDLFLVPIEVGESIQLKNVFFHQGSTLLRDESKPELDRLITILSENPSVSIELAGHTDNVGSASILLALSKQRVKSVKKYLTEKGVASSRIVGKGYGATSPIQKNDTEEHRKMNRRVEFKIIKK
jgi:outer membrane protein OmpA-like peptidoglycan-associated protein